MRWQCPHARPSHTPRSAPDALVIHPLPQASQAPCSAAAVGSAFVAAVKFAAVAVALGSAVGSAA